jgi:hypothetical protein
VRERERADVLLDLVLDAKQRNGAVGRGAVARAVDQVWDGDRSSGIRQVAPVTQLPFRSGPVRAPGREHRVHAGGGAFDARRIVEVAVDDVRPGCA